MDLIDIYIFKTLHLIHHFWIYQKAVTRGLIIQRDIIRFIKSKVIMYSGHRAGMDIRNVYEKIPLQRTRVCLDDNTDKCSWLCD
jgi:hypothetical protein